MIHPTALIHLKPAQRYTHTQKQQTESIQPLGLTRVVLCSPPHTCTWFTLSAGHSFMTLSSLWAWQGSSDEIRMTMGMTHSQAVESLEWIASHLLWFMSQSVCLNSFVLCSSMYMFSVYETEKRANETQRSVTEAHCSTSIGDNMTKTFKWDGTYCWRYTMSVYEEHCVSLYREVCYFDMIIHYWEFSFDWFVPFCYYYITYITLYWM